MCAGGRGTEAWESPDALAAIAARGTSSRSIANCGVPADRRSGTGGPGGGIRGAGERKRARELLLRAIRTARRANCPNRVLRRRAWPNSTGRWRRGVRGWAMGASGGDGAERGEGRVAGSGMDGERPRVAMVREDAEFRRLVESVRQAPRLHFVATAALANLAVPSSGRDNIRRVVMRHSRFLSRRWPASSLRWTRALQRSRIISRSRPSFTRTALPVITG